jgi:biotin carboxylase
VTASGAPSVLILGGAARSQGMRCIRQAQARGLRAVVADRAANLAAAPEIAVAADETADVAYDDPAACVAWAERRVAQGDVAGVHGFREYSVESVAEVARACGLPGNAPDAVRTMRDKLSCRNALRAAGFEQPAVAACASLDEALDFVAAHPPGPWIVKPRSAMGALGVRLVETPDELRAAWRADEREGRPDWLVEELQTGTEYSAEGVFLAGRPHVVALTEKRLVDGAFVARSQVMPAPLEAADSERLAAEVERALEALGLSHGFFHVEARMRDGQPLLGEVHARPGGGYIHLLVEVVYGIEPYGAVFDDLVGRQPQTDDWSPRGAGAIRYFVPPPGVVTAIGDLEAVAADPACMWLDLDLRPGDRVPPMRDATMRPGQVVALADTPQRALAAAESLHDRVGPVVTP